MTTDRDANGRFVKGHAKTPGSGQPRKAKVSIPASEAGDQLRGIDEPVLAAMADIAVCDEVSVKERIAAAGLVLRYTRAAIAPIAVEGKTHFLRALVRDEVVVQAQEKLDGVAEKKRSAGDGAIKSRRNAGRVMQTATSIIQGN